ncbi:MAG TPA: SRPBCC domain-containing protein [Gemmatimonadaceae bacterium]|jgi:uncharacterized protein YndB with AHSA1/START domain
MTAATIAFPHQLERHLTIRAPRALVFRYFTDSERWAKWWGPGSTIDARPGGKVYIRYPGDVEVAGEVIAIQPPEQIVFTYGFVSGTPVPPGASRVTIRLTARGPDTLLELTHEFAEAAARDEHVQGWRYQLSLFANVVADEVFADAEQAVNAWFTAWAEPNDSARAAMFKGIVTPEIQFRDRYSAIESVEDLVQQTGAAQRFMPGVRLERRGSIRHCQGMVLADWAMLRDGTERGRGTNVFVFAPSGLIEWVTGFWGT